MRALAAQRWVNARMAILQGGRAHSGNAVHLQALDAHLRTVSFTSFRNRISNRSGSENDGLELAPGLFWRCLVFSRTILIGTRG